MGIRNASRNREKKAGITAAALISIVLLASGQALAQDPLKVLAVRKGITIGTAVGSAFWGGDARYKAALKKEFNILVAENEMKWEKLEPQRGNFNWTRADELSAFAKENGAVLRGHVLVWHQQSGWIESGNFSRAEMLTCLRDHIQAVAGRYRGQVREWDVVNEAIDDGTAILRDSFWRRRIGDDYIDSAFHIAHRAAPEARLFYNDYAAEDMGIKSGKVYNLVKGMLARKVPIHGVGMQCHFENAAWPSPADIGRNMKRLADLGLEVSITELDFRVRLPADNAALERQKANYAALLRVCLANPNCKSVLTWGFTDAHSWVPESFQGMGAALPFDAEYRPKPAYYGLHETFLAPNTLVRRSPSPGQALGAAPFTNAFLDPAHPLLIRDAAGRTVFPSRPAPGLSRDRK